MNTNKHTLKTDDLTVGQQLVLVVRHGGNWGSEIRRTERTLTVKKILKNRLVLTDEKGVDYRYIVEFSKTYPYRNGEVSVDLEGSRARDNVWSIRQNHHALFTLDDPELYAGRDADIERNKGIAAKIEAQKTLDDFKRSLSVADAEAAITALHAYIKENTP